MKADMRPDASGRNSSDAADAPAVKICGLTSQADAEAVNAAGADYAGFVFHSKSKRNLSVERAREIMKVLDPKIIRVAVCVSPTPERIQEIQDLPFDIIQIHGSCPGRTLAEIRIPVWRAVNIADIRDLTVSAAEEGMERISGILVDAKEYGSGKAFDWAAAEEISQAVRGLCTAIEKLQGADVHADEMTEAVSSRNITVLNRKSPIFILAGGLHAGNVTEGIRLFSPDVVDVSSGVEYGSDMIGKDPEKVSAFTRAVRTGYQQTHNEAEI